MNTGCCNTSKDNAIQVMSIIATGPKETCFIFLNNNTRLQWYIRARILTINNVLGYNFLDTITLQLNTTKRKLNKLAAKAMVKKTPEQKYQAALNTN